MSLAYIKTSCRLVDIKHGLGQKQGKDKQGKRDLVMGPNQSQPNFSNHVVALP